MSLPKDKVYSLIFYTSQPTIQLNKPILVSVHIIQQKLNFTEFPKMVTDPRSLQESEGRDVKTVSCNKTQYDISYHLSKVKIGFKDNGNIRISGKF